LEDKFNDISRSWAARAIRTGDAEGRAFLSHLPNTPHHLMSPWDVGRTPTQGEAHGCWYDDSSPHNSRVSPIEEAFSLTEVDPLSPSLSYGHKEDVALTPLTNLAIHTQQDEHGKSRFPGNSAWRSSKSRGGG